MSFQDYSESIASRLRLGTVNPRLLIGVIVIIIAVLGFVAFSIFAGGATESVFAIESQGFSSVEMSEQVEAEEAVSAPVEICVHVGGCVNEPGLCTLHEGDRVADAIAAAGGMTPDAASDAINLARVLVDGEQIIVASTTAIAEAATREALPSVGSTGSGGSTVSGSAASSGKVNINTATSQELQTISGIGEAKAKKIIAYREKNGPFKTVDDLTKVSGIGEKTLESLRDQICV